MQIDFSQALLALKAGRRIFRHGWNGLGMWLSLTPGRAVAATNFWSDHNRRFAESQGGTAEVRSYITIKTADNQIVPWVASQSDLLAEDWEVT